MTRTNLVRMALALLTSTLALAGCGGTTTSHDMGATTSAAADRNDADIVFVQGMIPHHEGALDMAKLAPGRTSNPKVLDLAARIEKAQDPEIKTMTGWLRDWGVQPHGMDHGSDMAGLDDLKQAKDAAFDQLFLDLMIKHHEGAIDMSKTELDLGTNPNAKKLAEQIIDAQQAEINEMKTLQTG